VLAIGGIAALTLGGLLLVDGPIPEMRVHWATALAVSVPLGLITAFLMALAIRARRRKSMVGPQGLIGSTGVARTPLSPEGKVFIAGELWNAVASAEIPPGEQVRVRGVNGLVLDVEPLRLARGKANS
jgi:membrane-bound serine protease (ClpP class)